MPVDKIFLYLLWALSTSSVRKPTFLTLHGKFGFLHICLPIILQFLVILAAQIIHHVVRPVIPFPALFTFLNEDISMELWYLFVRNSWQSMQTVTILANNVLQVTHLHQFHESFMCVGRSQGLVWYTIFLCQGEKFKVSIVIHLSTRRQYLCYKISSIRFRENSGLLQMFSYQANINEENQ